MDSPGSMITRGADVQEDDCDVCRLLRKILQRIEQVEQRLSSLEQANRKTIYDPVYLDIMSRRRQT